MTEQTQLRNIHQAAIYDLLEGEALFDEKSRALYSTAACMYKIRPQGIVYPRNSSDVQRIVNYARANGLSLTARGAGSSLVGQAVNSGLIIDFTRFMNGIIQYDPQTETVRLQPGVILGQLNRYLKPFDRYFPPDPSSGEYCTVGGMIANNATGSHALKCGSTVDYVDSLQVVLADGRIIKTTGEDLNSAKFRERFNRTDAESDPAVFIYQLLKKNERLIRDHTPKVKKNASGYRLEKVIGDKNYNLGKLFCSSEGTLGIITEISFKVRQLPKHKILTVVNFDSLEDAAASVEPILESGPSAVEMMEKKAISLVRQYRPELHEFFPEESESQLYIEYDGPDQNEITDQNNQLVQYLKTKYGAAISLQVATDPSEQQALWKIRKASFPLVYNERRPEKVLAFIEDNVVNPKDIAAYIRRLYRIYDKYQTDSIILGHASSGNFHARPFINLKDKSDVVKMQKIADEVFDVVMELGGSVSGEHGDGRARAHYLPRLVGPLFELYEEIKQYFDPHGILNPGVKINRKNQLTENLRLKDGPEQDGRECLLHFEDDGYAYEVEKCHGCSACHQTNITTTMCPVFQVTKDELASPRGKANVLQNLLSGDLAAEEGYDASFKQMLDYCIYCEGCYVECSSHVDVGKLMLEHKARYRQQHGADRLHLTLEHSELLSRVNGWFAPISNPLMNNKIIRRVMEKTIGIDHRRTMPKAEWPGRYRKNKQVAHVAEPLERVVFFPDLYARYNDSSLMRKAIRILEHSGVSVTVPDLKSAAMPALVYGNIELARSTVRKNLQLLEPYLQQGYKIVSTEPTAVLALRREWQDIIPGSQTKNISENSYEFFEFLQNLWNKNNCWPTLHPVEEVAAYHAPCHLRALRIGLPGVDVLKRIPGLDVREVNRGCCGIAGTYGFKKGDKGFDQSMLIGSGLFEELSRSEISYGLSECSTCRLQMEQGSKKKSIHPLEILTRAIGPDLIIRDDTTLLSN